MKCPKCGFNSFEYHDVCKKCSSDLAGYKLTHGILPVVLPREAREEMVSSQRTAETDETDETEQAAQVPETHADMFTFDLPEDETPAQDTPPSSDRNPFNFDEEPAAPAAQAFAGFTFDEEEASETDAPAPGTPPTANSDPFAFDDELDVTKLPSLDDLTFPGDQQSAQTKAEDDAFADLLESPGRDDTDDGTATSPPPAGAPGEFDLENFAWNDTSATEQSPSSSAPETAAEPPAEFELENFAWDATPAATKQPTPSSPPEAASGNPGEFDLDSFSWETPATGTKPGDDTKDTGTKP